MTASFDARLAVRLSASMFQFPQLVATAAPFTLNSATDTNKMQLARPSISLYIGTTPPMPDRLAAPHTLVLDGD